MKTNVITYCLCLMLLSGCATSGKSILTGGGAGAVVGGLVGQGMGKNSKSTAIGAAVGMGVGALIGYMGYKDKKRKGLIKSEEKSKSKKTKEKNLLPYLTKPKVRTIWVPDKIEGKKYIKGHFIHVIEDAGNWSLDD